MRKILLVVLFLFLLTGCETETVITVDIELNPGNDTVEIGTMWEDSGATLYINSEELTIYSNNSVNENMLGLYTIKYEITYLDIEYSVTRYVHVVDQTPPMLVLVPQIDTIQVGTDYTDLGVIVNDNSNESIEYSVIGTINTNQVGVYELIYTATDSSGNTASISRFVHVIQ